MDTEHVRAVKRVKGGKRREEGYYLKKNLKKESSHGSIRSFASIQGSGLRCMPTCRVTQPDFPPFKQFQWL
jgi:hypothetical protein